MGLKQSRPRQATTSFQPYEQFTSEMFLISGPPNGARAPSLDGVSLPVEGNTGTNLFALLRDFPTCQVQKLPWCQSTSPRCLLIGESSVCLCKIRKKENNYLKRKKKRKLKRCVINRVKNYHLKLREKRTTSRNKLTLKINTFPLKI